MNSSVASTLKFLSSSSFFLGQHLFQAFRFDFLLSFRLEDPILANKKQRRARHGSGDAVSENNVIVVPTIIAFQKLSGLRTAVGIVRFSSSSKGLASHSLWSVGGGCASARD